MKKLTLSIAALLILWGGYARAGVPTVQQDADAQATADSGLEKADSTRAVVEGVLTSAVEAGAEEHPVASGSLADARMWIEQAEKARGTAAEAYEAEDFDKAATMYNMVWQYYVKAGTAAVLAARLASGGGP